jgi:hypothetical protein
LGNLRICAELEWFLGLEIWDPVQRRGTHVNTPKIGSRVGVYCSGGILRFCAELRRKTFWGNFKLDLFWVLGVSPRGPTEEGGTISMFWGNLFGDSPV